METKTGAAAAGGASAAAAKEAEVTQEIPYAKSGEAFTIWLNRRLSEKGNVTVPLGTKSATVNRLLPDGRLDCDVPGEGGAGSHQQFVSFDETMFDLILPKVSNI